MPNPPWNPDEQTRAKIEMMAGMGLTHEQIGMLVDCSPKTLRLHCAAELKRGDANATLAVAQSLYKRAIGPNPNPAAAIFWMKARAGWREKQELDITSGGAAFGVQIYLPDNGRPRRVDPVVEGEAEAEDASAPKP